VTEEVDPTTPESEFQKLLQTRPVTEALTIDQSSGRLNYIIPLDNPASQ